MSKDIGALVEQEILSRLEALQANTLYFITTKSVLLQGFKTYEMQRLESFSWQKGRAVLEATVLEEAFDDRRSKVSISIQDQGLRYRCSCRDWNAGNQCKHLICTLLSVINIFSPKLYYQARHDKSRIQNLKSELLQVRPGADQDAKHSTQKGLTLTSVPRPRQAAKSLYQLVIQTTETYPSIYVRKGGKIIDSTLHLPQALAVFIFSYYSISALQERFKHYLKIQGNHFPLILVSDYGEMPIEWDAKLHFQSKTELNICDDQIAVRSLCLLKGVVSEKVLRFWNFIVDLETGKLGSVQNTDGWRLFTEIDRLFDRPAYFDDDDLRGDRFKEKGHPDQRWIVRNSHFQIPLKVFQSFQLNFTKEAERGVLNDLVLKVKGQTTPPRQLKHRHRLHIESGHFDSSSLRAQCLLGESPDELPVPSLGATTASTFTFFLEINKRNLPSPLKALKRQVVLCETFLKLLTLTKKESGARVIRKALSNGDFVQYSIKRPARELLKRYFEAFLKQDLRIWASPAGWAIAPNDKRMEAQLYRIPFELFGVKIFNDISSYHEMRVPTKALHDQLPLLHLQCKLAGIDLHYQGKPISSTSWDFSFDAKREAGIDWFEIKPEISCNGKMMKEEEWQRLLEQNGVIEKDGEIHIADAATQKILKSLSLIYKKEKPDERTKRTLVQVPSLQILDWIALRKEGVRITLSDEDEALIKSLVEFKTIEKIRTPRRLQATLRPYQKEGLDWLAFLYQHRFGACLADDMGLGKTIQAISLLAAIKEKIVPSIVGKAGRVGEGGDGFSSDHPHHPHLIVVPPSLLFNWESEIERFYPELSIYSYVGKDRKCDFKGKDIVMTTYALIRRDIEKLKDIPFHIIIFDEAQAVKNVYAETTSAVRLLKSHFKLVITGTPLENHLGEYYSLIDLCLPGLLGEYESFRSETKRENEAMLKVMIARTRPFVLRRVKEAILKELPPKVEIDIYLDLTTKQRGLYQKTVASIKSAIDSAYAQKTHAQAKIIALTAILKLRQLCISTKLLDPDSGKQGEHSPKMSYLIKQLQELLEEGHSALVFSQFTSGLDLFEVDLKNSGIPFFRLDGKTPTQKRKDLVKGFQEGTEPSIFLLSLKAGGQGLNLTKASYVFHLDPWWNPAVENQASDRAHRIGQKNKVTVTRILMRHTIEEKMMFLKEKKSALYDTVMGGEEKSGRAYAISKTDFDFLLN